MSNDLEKFEVVLAHLLSPDNNLRNQAEKIFENTKQQSPDFFASSLLHFLKNSTHEQIRAFSAVMLRKTLGKSTTSIWDNIKQHQETVKQEILLALEKEQVQHIRTKIAHLISDLASHVFDQEGTWPQLLPFIINCTKSESDGIRESGMDILGNLSEDLYELVKDHLNDLKLILKGGLSDQKSLKVRVSALLATANFVQVFEKQQDIFQDLLPLMLGTISAALNANQEEEAREALELFVDLVELSPNFLKPYVNSIVPAMFTIASATNLEDGTRQLGLEFLVTFAERRAAWARKYPKFVETLLPVIVNMMLEVEDEDDTWNTNDEVDETEITNSDVAEECLDRISIAVGGKTLVPLLFSAVPTLMGASDWKHRHTALLAISIVGEGCKKIYQT